MITIEILAIIGAIYILIDAIRLIIFLSKHYELGNKWKNFYRNTVFYREYEIRRFRKYHYKQWETLDEIRLNRLEWVLINYPRYKRNKYTPEYLRRVRELQKQLKDKNFEEWKP